MAASLLVYVSLSKVYNELYMVCSRILHAHMYVHVLVVNIREREILLKYIQ